MQPDERRQCERRGQREDESRSLVAAPCDMDAGREQHETDEQPNAASDNRGRAEIIDEVRERVGVVADGVLEPPKEIRITAKSVEADDGP